MTREANAGTSADVRTRLLDAARTALVEDGFAGTSARTIAARAEAAPGSIYYHFGDLDSLLAETSRSFSRERAEVWRAGLSACSTLTAIVQVARELHATERELGSLVVLGQLLSGGRGNATISTAVHENFELLAGIVEQAIARVLVDTPLEATLDPHDLARTISAGFLGLELLDDAIPDGGDLFAQLEVLATLADEVLGAGWITSTWLRRRLDPSGRSARRRT